MGDRTFTCPDCPQGLVHTAGARGPVPTRCKKHLTRAKNRRARRVRVGLHVVDPAAAPPAPVEAPAGVEPDWPPADEPPAARARLADIVRRELDAKFIDHPAAETLTALAVLLATQAETPETLADARITATVGRELRATVEALTAKREGAQDADDPFGFGDLPTSLGHASAS